MICKVCGKEFPKVRYGKPYQDICSSECFTYNFWDEIVKEKDEHLIIDGTCYRALPYVENPDNSNFLGFGGREFQIRVFNDNSIIRTNNLWCQGDIPSTHRDKLPDNAEFITKKKEDENDVH